MAADSGKSATRLNVDFFLFFGGSFIRLGALVANGRSVVGSGMVESAMASACSLP